MSQVSDFPIFIDPPDVLTQRVDRLLLREALRLAMKFGKVRSDTEAYLYSTDAGFFVEAGSFRRSFPLDGEWSGCVSLQAELLLKFWNKLPKCQVLSIQYERGWLNLDSLSLGRAVWQPKYDPQWMTQ